MQLKAQAELLVREGVASTWGRHPDEHLNLDQAAALIAEGMAQFDAYVSNIQGACDTDSFDSMMAEAKRLYEEAAEA